MIQYQYRVLEERRCRLCGFSEIQMDRPFCKKCFFENIDPNGIYADIKDMIAVIPESEKADENEYRRRLDICGSCEFLGEGTCGKCGCFVELRAAKLKMGCPHEKHYW